MMVSVIPGTEERLARLTGRLRREQRLIVAFSGGADSSLLAAAAGEVLGAGALAVTAVSPSLPSAERRAAREFTRARGIRHLEVCTDEEERPGYIANGGDRCYHCKSALFDALAPLAAWLDASIALATTSTTSATTGPGSVRRGNAA
jgi:pyridinium-3,5-biscarboxylic acid mononucleotide sulfurtransferase